MAKMVDQKVIKKTQESLGAIIKKPPLNEKLLTKPPFRFLHDVITNIIQATKFFEGLYVPDEMISENVKDKEKKIAFLQKAIDVTIMVTGENLTVKPTKIVAGHEPEKTNEFLQAIAKAITNKQDSNEAVQKVLNGEKPSIPTGNPKRKGPEPSDQKLKTKVPAARESKSINKSSTKATGSKSKTSVKNNLSDQNRSHNRNRTKERENSKDRSKPKTQEPKTEVKKASSLQKIKSPEKTSSPQRLKSPEKVSSPQKAQSPEKEKSETIRNDSAKHKEKVSSANGNKENRSEIDIINQPTSNTESNEDTEDTNVFLQNLQNSASAESPPSSITRPATAVRVTSAKIPHPQIETPNIPQSSESQPQPEPNEIQSQSFSRSIRSATPKSARPSSARPAPPKIRIRHIVENEEQIRLPSAKPVANVILDTQDQSDNEDDTFITEESTDIANIEKPPVLTAPPTTAEEEQGSLVKQLLETKKDLEGGSQQIPSKKVEIDKSQMTDASRKREKESTSKELEQLRSFIQTVSRSANPLGKILDYLQEDIDSMQQELKMWQDEHQQNLMALNREESVTENVLDPLRAQLEELEQAVQDQLDGISTLKSSILRNDERIYRMLAAVNQPQKS